MSAASQVHGPPHPPPGPAALWPCRSVWCGAIVSFLFPGTRRRRRSPPGSMRDPRTIRIRAASGAASLVLRLGPPSAQGRWSCLGRDLWPFFVRLGVLKMRSDNSPPAPHRRCRPGGGRHGEGGAMPSVKEAAAAFLANQRIAVTGVSRTPKSHGSNVVYQRLRDAAMRSSRSTPTPTPSRATPATRTCDPSPAGSRRW
jgi:hypothetical protein